MAEYCDRTFHNRTLVLDGERFEGCRFINADLRHKGGAAFAMQGCRFEGYLNLEITVLAPGSEEAQGSTRVADAITTSEAARRLDDALAQSGFNLDLEGLVSGGQGPVWRFHTLLPRLVPGLGRSPL